MSLYLHESITPEVIREAKKAGITGVKSYPAGVTTVSPRPNLTGIQKLSRKL
jgi:dihydroorotase